MIIAKPVGMIRKLLLSISCSLALLAPLSLAAETSQTAIRDREGLAHIFADQGVSGAFVLLDARAGTFDVVNTDFAAPRRIPASTFKIVNSLIALETGAVRDTDEIIPYGGGQTPVAAWAQDMSMRDAIVVSNVPVYQELARRIGLETYSQWLRELDYGNANPGTDVETFWLKGPLRISPFEQTQLLAQLAEGQLPFSAQNQAMVREILFAGEQNGRQIFAKSGWTTAPDPDIGWYVGWVEGAGELHAFALVMEVHDRRDADLRQELAFAFLRAFDVL